MLYNITVRFYHHQTKVIKYETVKDYGIPQAIEKVRFNHSYNVFVLSAHFDDIELLIYNLQS